MQHIDEKFKDNTPQKTVEKIRGILEGIGVSVTENWCESGVEHCYSLSVSAGNGSPITNGKGITKDLARASAYGEFIERLQGGLFYCKFQSISRIPGMNIHSFAPDARYMTVPELINEGQWMDHLVEAYPELGLSRQSIAQHCLAYACATDGMMLAVPFYSLFEDKYVYLPAAFVEQMYTTNGCCAGNTREEAWVHALSEIMERHSSITYITKGIAAPKIPEETLRRYATVSTILDQIQQSGEYDVEIFDYSLGTGFPVVSTRIISKKTHGYRVNVAADPVLEIAIQRTLTEMFQGKTMKSVTTSHDGQILSGIDDFPALSNVINQLETSSGFYTADYFANELTCTETAAEFEDRSDMTNKELLSYMLGLYKNMGKQIYIRNLSYLGFPSYKFVIPGFSETRALSLRDVIPQYAIADDAAKTLRNVETATDDDLNWMLIHNKMISTVQSQYLIFGRNAGIPISGIANSLLNGVTQAYTAYRLNRLPQAIAALNKCVNNGLLDSEDRGYFACVNKYLEMKNSQIEEEKIQVILEKFFDSKYPARLYSLLKQGKTPYDDYLIRCDYQSCQSCRYSNCCSFVDALDIYQKAGAEYKKFTAGQDRSEFVSDF